MAIKKNTVDTIILFDGECNLCNAGINYIIKKDSKKQFRFVPLQSIHEELLIEEMLKKRNYPDSIILIKNHRIYTRSNAIINIAVDLGGLHKIVIIFKIVPFYIRDFIYDIIAKYRYKLFGKNESCYLC